MRGVVPVGVRVGWRTWIAATLLLPMLGACQLETWQTTRSQAVLDDASIGYADGGVADPGNNPSAGAFFNDGHEGDARARTQNLFRSKGKSADLPDVSAAGGPRERMLVYTGEVRIEVARAEDAAAEFLARVEKWGGYLKTQRGTDLIVRLPAAHFDEAFTALREAGRVLAEQRRANDVTEEFVDLGIRVDNARRSRERLLAILEKAEKVEDILAVEKELRRLTEEIERMEGRLKFLRDQVAMATLTAEFQSVREAPPPPPKKRRYSRFSWVNRVGPKAVMEGF